MNSNAETFARDPGTVDRDNPWPGLASFRERDQPFFHGRDAAIQILLDLVSRERVAVLYGASGLGKTSLIQAGLFPRARAHDLFPVRLRLDFARPSALIDQIFGALFREAEEHHIEAPERTQATLWEFFHRKTSLWWNDRHRLVTPLLVFDQFEEMFTIGRRTPERSAAARAFLEELRGLALGFPPGAVRARVDAAPEEALQYSVTRGSVRVLFSFREDYLAEFTELRELFPSIGEHDFRLLPMSTDEGLRVILSPGGHLVSEPVARRIVEIIAAERPVRRRAARDLPVDPTLLSVFCRELNNERRRLKQEHISGELLKDAQTRILDNFYARSIAGLDPRVQVFIEDELVLPDSSERNSVAEEVALRKPGITQETIDALIDRRLLRRDEQDGPARIELAHDVLIDPVRRSGELRHAREAEQQATREAADRFEQLQRARRQRFLVALSVAGLFALVFGVIAAVLAVRASEEATKVRQALASKSLIQASAKAAEEGHTDYELAYVAYAATTDATDGEARERLIDRLLHKTWPLPLAVFTHTAPVTGAAFDASGSRVLTLSDADGLQVWSMTAPNDPARQLARDVSFARFASNRAALIVTRSTIELWEAATGRRLHAIPRPDAAITAAALSADASLLAAGDEKGHLHMWRLSSPGAKPVTREAYETAVSIVQFSDDGRRLLTASGGNATIWLVTSLTPVRLQSQDATIESADFSPSGAEVVTTYKDGMARLWHTAAAGTGPRPAAGVPPYATLRHDGSVTFAQFSPDGQSIVTASIDGTAGIWNTVGGHAVTNNPLRHHGPVVSAVFSPDGSRILTASRDGSARLWDAAGAPIAEPIWHARPLTSARFSPDGERVVTASDDATAEVWDVRAGAAVPETWNGDLPRMPLSSVQFGAKDRYVLISDAEQMAHVWDASDGSTPLHTAHEAVSPPQLLADGQTVLVAVRSRASLLRIGTGGPMGQPMEVEGPIRVARASGDGSRIAVLSATGMLRVWDANGRILVTDRADTGSPDAPLPILLDFSNDGRWLAVPGARPPNTRQGAGVIRVWDLSNAARPPRELNAPAPLISAAFSPDAKWLLAFGRTETAYVFDLGDSSLEATFRAEHDGVVSSARFGSTGDALTIATTSTDGTAKVWRQPWDPWRRVVLRHGAAVLLASFSRDGDRVITAATDGVARVWNPRSENVSAELVHPSVVSAAAFSADANRVVTAAADGRARIWDLPSGTPDDVARLATLANLVAGYRVNDEGVLVPLNGRIQQIEQERRAVAQSQPSDSASRSSLATQIAAWLLGDRWNRRISPFSKTDVKAFINAQLSEGTDEAWREALRVYPGHPLIGRTPPTVAAASNGESR